MALALGGLLVLLVMLWGWHAPIREVLGLATEEKQPPSTQTRTLKFFIFQQEALLVTPASTTTPFSIFIGESSPVIKDASIEIRGVTKAVASQTITADINQTDSFPTSRQRSFEINSSGKPNFLRVFYSGSPTQSLSSYLAGIITSAGSYSFYLKTAISGADVSVLQAKMVITYQFTPPTEGGGLPATGELVSPTFDTYAVNGANFNWILWKGSAPAGTRVRLQLATSNSSGGPFTFIGRSGTTCNSTTFYEPAVNTSVEIGCQSDHNNKRYFRYKAQLCSSSDCSSSGTQTPTVDDVIVNWSP